MSDDALPPPKPLTDKTSRAMIEWVATNQLGGETDATRCAWMMGALVLRLRGEYKRAHLSQLVSTAYSIVVAAERLRALQRKDRGNVGVH